MDPWESTQDLWAPGVKAGHEPEPPAADSDDLLLGMVTGIASEIGDLHLLAALLEARLVTDGHGWDWGLYHFSAVLFVPRHTLPLFTEERAEVVRDALNDARAVEKHQLRDLDIRSLVLPATSSWREDLAKRLESGGPLNQARVGHAVVAASEDGLDFRSLQERAVYRELKRATAKAAPDLSVGIVPLPGFRTAAGRVLEPDFLVTHKGRVAGIEVDGPHHSRRAAADHSRDRLLQHSGLSFVERITVEEADDPVELGRFVLGFLRRLARS